MSVIEQEKKIKQMGAVALLVILMFIMGCFFIKDDKVKTLEKNDYGKTLEKNDYGVFLNADASSLERFKKYDLIVIDAQYFTKRISNRSIKMEQRYIRI